MTKRPHRRPNFLRPGLFLTGAVALLLAACSSGGGSGPGMRPYISPIGAGMEGLEHIVGASPQQLVRLFGQPRLDVVEPYGRKLQFSGDPCILDAYLYPDKSGNERVTYVDARNHDGVEVNRASCARALER